MHHVLSSGRGEPMKLTGETALNAPLERVYAAMYEPVVLERAIPGCDRLVPAGDGAYRMTISVGIAALKGTFGGDLWVEDRQAPHTFSVRATSTGPMGSVVAGVDVLLEEGRCGRTMLTYEGDLDVDGPITAVGQFLMTRTARRAATEFFTAVNKVFLAEAPAAAEPVSSGRSLLGAARSGLRLLGA
jgi:carbon monoxide dehydrogenase subunit G